jgi:alkaline phosphatase
MRSPSALASSLPRLAVVAVAALSLLPSVAWSDGGEGGEGAAMSPPTSVIFIHPDGAGLGHWGLLRIHAAGPDGELAWDRLPAMATYRPHMRDSLAPSSHSGGTVHAYGVKVPQDSFGMDGAQVPVAASGERLSIMREAARAGRAVGVINSGHLAEPGTACFLASVPKRSMTAEIARQLLEAKAQVILGGGEALFLPKGVAGRHGVGRRDDGRDLVAEARAAGYAVVFTREELAAVPAGTTHLLGLFAEMNTYNDRGEESLRERGLVPYPAAHPTVGEMTRAALRVLAADPDGFMLVVEEEGTDNFSNTKNAAGLLEALRRADEVIAIAEAHRAANPATLVLVAADSDASRPQVVAMPESDGVIVRDKPLPATLPGDGAALDGVDGAGTVPFLAAADRNGVRLPFAVAWASHQDGGDPVIVRAAGPASELVRGNLDNTDLYRIMYAALFGREPGAPRDSHAAE